MATVRSSRVSRARYTSPHPTSTDQFQDFVGADPGAKREAHWGLNCADYMTGKTPALSVSLLSSGLTSTRHRSPRGV
jgi:hypothetical protein